MTDSNRIGVCIAGSNGAVATTMIAGAALMRRGLAPRHGMITETDMVKGLDVAPLDEIVFGGWDLRSDTAFHAAGEHNVVPIHLLHQVKDELEAIKPWPAVASAKYLGAMNGKNLVTVSSFREEIATIT